MDPFRLAVMGLGLQVVVVALYFDKGLQVWFDDFGRRRRLSQLRQAEPRLLSQLRLPLARHSTAIP